MKISTKFSITLLTLAFSMSAMADDSMKTSFLEACSSSPYIAETSDCTCVYNEANHDFGADDLAELIPIISGSQSMDKEVQSAINFIAGKCES